MKWRSRILAKQVSKLAGDAYSLFLFATLEVVFLSVMSSELQAAQGRRK